MARVIPGDIVRIWRCSTFKQMGFRFVTGEVFMVYEDGVRFVLRCDQTRAMEIVKFSDGTIEIINQIDPRRNLCRKPSQSAA